jgi:hypothetical protein
MTAESLAHHRSIFAPVIALSFSAAQEQDLIAYITKRSANTELVPISDIAQLTMTAAGRLTESGYRFNLLGFLAVCRGIAGGLSRLFAEVSGESPTKLIDADFCSIPAAVSIYNEALRVKFESLRERTLLIDHHARTVEGFLGLSHKLLDNQLFLELISAEQASAQPEAVFHRAELVGRELAVYILDPASRRSDVYSDPTHTFAAGWYFCNREDTGNSVRAIPCVYTRFGVALMPNTGKQRLAHVGADLAGRAGMLIGKTFHRTVELTTLRQRVAELTAINLGFAAKKDMEPVTKKWVNYLASIGVPNENARLIVKNAITVGADIVPRSPLDIFTDKVLAERTAYDLVCSVLRYARKQDTLFREKIQSVGYSLLFPDSQK